MGKRLTESEKDKRITIRLCRRIRTMEGSYSVEAIRSACMMYLKITSEEKRTRKQLEEATNNLKRLEKEAQKIEARR